MNNKAMHLDYETNIVFPCYSIESILYMVTCCIIIQYEKFTRFELGVFYFISSSSQLLMMKTIKPHEKLDLQKG